MEKHEEVAQAKTQAENVHRNLRIQAMNDTLEIIKTYLQKNDLKDMKLNEFVSKEGTPVYNYLHEMYFSCYTGVNHTPKPPLIEIARSLPIA